ncbi:MAG TPA: hypothetical protein VHW00_19865 [Thermoanaerobaculia bacterium]|nr:hypothetical protein [Thermoanaerobaculia bacterium]
MSTSQDPEPVQRTAEVTKDVLESEQMRWEVDKLAYKRRVLEEVVGILQHDRNANGALTKIVDSMATLADRDPAPFWSERSAPAVNARINLSSLLPNNVIGSLFGGGGVLNPGNIDLPNPFPSPGDVLGQILNHVEAEKKMITDLVTKLLT